MRGKTRSDDKRHYSIRSFLSYMGQYRWQFAVTMIAFAIGNILLALIPVFLGKLIGALGAHPAQGHQALIWVWALIIMSSGHNIFWRAGELLHMQLINPLSALYDTLLFREIIRKPYPFFVDKFTGKLSSYVNTISQEMREFFTDVCYNYTSQAVNLVATLIILSAVNWQTGLIFLTGIVIMFVVGRKTAAINARYERRATDVQSTKNAHIVDAITNFVNVKSFRTELKEWRQLAAEQEGVIASSRRAILTGIFFWGCMGSIVRDLLWPATIGLNVYLFLHHEINLAQLTVVLSTILIFTTSIWEAVWYVSQFNLKLARIEEAHRYLFGPVNLVKQLRAFEAGDIDVPKFTGTLAFDHLSFAYPDKSDVAVLRDINLELHKGEKLGIVGRSGSGKTTLTKLLLGYYDVDSGILLDGKLADSQEISRLISYVPQDTSLFHRSIADNIAYAATRDVSQHEIEQAAKRAHAHEFISQIDDGYEALVGERGVKLSAGQRQRIAIARAFLDDKPILILDEATSALDSESEVLVQEALEALWHDKTVIAIAHRLSTLRHMDRIIVMDDGQIIEQGTHNELLNQNGHYAKLWAHQSGGFIDEE